MEVRSQQLCAGCGAEAVGHYCHACGQVARPRLPTVGDLLRDAARALLDTDGRLLRSLRRLLVDPGRLSRAYLTGQRSSYLSPVQLLLIGGVSAALVSTRVPRSEWGMLYDFTLQIPGDALGEWAPWGVLLVSTPIMALALNALFWRRDTRFTGHWVVTLHWFSAILVVATLETGVIPVARLMPGAVRVVEMTALLWAFVLSVRALRTTYGASLWSAVWRVGVLGVVYLGAYMAGGRWLT